MFSENQSENFTQSVESSGKVKSTKAWDSTSKCSKLEMKTQSAPKAGKMHFPTYCCELCDNLKAYDWYAAY